MSTPDQRLMDLGQKIIEYRNNADIKQEAFAKELGISRTTLSFIENGSQAPSFEVLVKLAQITNINFNELIDVKSKAEEDPLPSYLQKYFSKIVRVTRLREVRVLLGFTRVDAPDPDADPANQPNIVTLSKGRNERWLPAAEVNGEGIFIEFNKEMLSKWLGISAVKDISERYAESYKDFCQSKGWTITSVRNAVYVLMHTFAHLLIKQMMALE